MKTRIFNISFSQVDYDVQLLPDLMDICYQLEVAETVLMAYVMAAHRSQS